MSRTVLWLMAAGAVVIAAAVGGVWHGKLSELTTLGQAAKPTAAASSAPVPSQPVLAPAPQTEAPEVAGRPASTLPGSGRTAGP